MGHDEEKKVRDVTAEAREELENMSPFELKNDLFLVHGWGDPANVGWTYPYSETGDDRAEGQKDTFDDWAKDKILNRAERVHYVKLVEDESKLNTYCDRFGKLNTDLRKDGDYDKTYYYENFFQFAELLKTKIDEERTTKKVNLLCHSMGGLDAVAAIAVDKKDDEKGFIKKPYLKRVDNLITVATPHRGSPLADWSDSKVTEFVLHNSAYIRTQGENMKPKSYFVMKINELAIRERLMRRVSSVYTFGGGSDPLAPTPNYKINTKGIKKNSVIGDTCFKGLEHSQRMAITQKPQLMLSVFKILSQ